MSTIDPSSDQFPLAYVKSRLSEVVDRVQREHARLVITKHGKPAVAMLSIEDLESLEETLAILSDEQAMADIREAEREIEAGRATPMTKDEALSLIRRK